MAICDIDDNTLDKAATKSFPNAAKYNDFRKMLDEIGKNIDAVTVSTPDHMHAPASAMAMRMGKACFTQKPLTHTIYEARKLGEIAREMKVATQMGNQGTASNSLRKTAALVRAGAVGNVKEVHVWTNRPIWPQGGRPSGPSAGAAERSLGPVARPRARASLRRPAITRSRGAAGGTSAPARWATWPATRSTCRSWPSICAIRPPCKPRPRATTRTAIPSGRSSPTSSPPTAIARPLTMVWYDGGKKPSAELFDGQEVSETGVLLIGDKGKLFAPGDYCEKGYKLLAGATDPEVDVREPLAAATSPSSPARSRAARRPARTSPTTPAR